MDALELSLFRGKKEALIFFTALSVLFFVNIFLKYQKYNEFKSSKYYKTQALVLKEFEKVSKKGKSYRILKLLDRDGKKFYAIAWQKFSSKLQGDEISLKIRSDKVDFYDFLKGFFAPAYDIKILNKTKSIKEKISIFIKNQHKNQQIKELFSALFLGTSVSKDLRKKLQTYGISHLLAISGFHLGVLFAVMFFALSVPYKILQDRYFPYRNIGSDISLIVFMLLFLYLYLLGFMPSLVRSFVMLVLGYLLYMRHIKIISFEVVFITATLLLSLFPELIFSISFWFSISGVFYIFLFLHYFSHLKKWMVFLSLNIWVFFMMLPVVHFVFGGFCLYQLFCIPLSFVFVIFYPLELALHALNIGSLLDGYLLGLFDVGCKMVEIKTPFWFLALFISFSFLSVYKKIFLYILIFLDTLFCIFLLYRYTLG